VIIYPLYYYSTDISQLHSNICCLCHFMTSSFVNLGQSRVIFLIFFKIDFLFYFFGRISNDPN